MTKRHTIMVVDDEVDVVKSVRDLLRFDHNIIGITDPTEAMNALNRGEVHVVITDQRMPGTTGVQLLNEIRTQYPDVIRLLCTGYADIKAVIEAVNEGQIYRYVSKPFDADEFQWVVRDACDHFDLLEERRQLIEELQSKNAELKQSSELKEAFIRVAGHELRTPVTLLSGFSYLALQSSDLSQATRDHLLQISDATDRLKKLMNQILKMLSNERTDNLCNRKPENLASLLALALEDIRPFANRRSQTLQMEIIGELGPVEIDAEKIRDCVNQLLLNAVKFSDDGATIHLKSWRGGTNIFIAVQDHGCGITPACLPRIFEPFFTGFDVSRHSSGDYEHNAQGLGLGLSIVKAFAELHGGDITVESQPGKGTTFTILFPASAEQPQAPDSN